MLLFPALRQMPPKTRTEMERGRRKGKVLNVKTTPKRKKRNSASLQIKEEARGQRKVSERKKGSQKEGLMIKTRGGQQAG